MCNIVRSTCCSSQQETGRSGSLITKLWSARDHAGYQNGISLTISKSSKGYGPTLKRTLEEYQAQRHSDLRFHIDAMLALFSRWRMGGVREWDWKTRCRWKARWEMQTGSTFSHTVWRSWQVYWVSCSHQYIGNYAGFIFSNTLVSRLPFGVTILADFGTPPGSTHSIPIYRIGDVGEFRNPRMFL